MSRIPIRGKVPEWEFPIPTTPVSGTYGELVKHLFSPYYGTPKVAQGQNISTTPTTVISISGKGMLTGILANEQEITDITIDGVSLGGLGYPFDEAVDGGFALPCVLRFKSSLSISAKGDGAATGTYGVGISYQIYSTPASSKKWTEEIDEISYKEIEELYDEEGKLLHRIETRHERRDVIISKYPGALRPSMREIITRILADLEAIKKKLEIGSG